MAPGFGKAEIESGGWVDFKRNDDFISDFLWKPFCRVEAWSTSEGLASCGAEGEILEDNPQVG